MVEPGVSSPARFRSLLPHGLTSTIDLYTNLMPYPDLDTARASRDGDSRDRRRAACGAFAPLVATLLLCLGPSVISLAAAPAAAPAAALTPDQEEFFESKIRPVLIEKCGTCHGPQIQQGDLRLDTPAFLTGKLRRGVAVVTPGKPEASPLIQVLQPDSKIKMPPTGPLPQAEVKALEEWVRAGAFWPAGKVAARAASGGHWAFQPVKKPSVPAVRDRYWGRTPIDAFILERLKKKGLRPSGYADRRTLIRRASFDLTGLPPTPEELKDFVEDRSADAWEKVVDRLLASPHYGERWGRYWLDIARYADSKGYVFVEERRYPFAYTYRDYVVRSLNEDKPYDRFLVEQIAADQLGENKNGEEMAALGFLTLGRRFLNNQADIIDDRLDVVFRGTQGLTVSCARCHDHKFDPIPTADYYSLYGVFASSEEPAELPLIGQPERNQEYLKYEAELKQRQAAVDNYVKEEHGKLLKMAKEKIAPAMMAVRAASLPGGKDPDPGDVGLPGVLLAGWREFIQKTSASHHQVFTPWFALQSIPDSEWQAKAPAALAEARKRGVINKNVAAMLDTGVPASAQELADRYAALLQNPGDDQQLVHALDSIGGPLNIEVANTPKYFDRASRDAHRNLVMKVDEFTATSPAAPPRAMALFDRPAPVQPRIFKRGNPSTPGEEVPRQFLALLSGPERKPFRKGSGRLEMAQAIASPTNPLTARVMVNRVWGLHFGTPLVSTPSDFGLRSAPPTHPELLDWLADWFVENDWSLKRLHRLLMTSTVYMQGSDVRTEAAAKDPENQLYWRMNRIRLDFEALRDSILAAAGTMDRELYGRPVDGMFDADDKYPLRRTLYGFIDRQNLPGLLRVFDFASPDTHSPGRFQTTVPQQALFLMNSPFMRDQAAALVKRAGTGSDEQRLKQLYMHLFQREPYAHELKLTGSFVASAAPATGEAAGPDRWEQLAQALLMSNEFTFID